MGRLFIRQKIRCSGKPPYFGVNLLWAPVFPPAFSVEILFGSGTFLVYRLPLFWETPAFCKTRKSFKTSALFLWTVNSPRESIGGRPSQNHYTPTQPRLARWRRMVVIRSVVVFEPQLFYKTRSFMVWYCWTIEWIQSIGTRSRTAAHHRRLPNLHCLLWFNTFHVTPYGTWTGLPPIPAIKPFRHSFRFPSNRFHLVTVRQTEIWITGLVFLRETNTFRLLFSGFQLIPNQT